MALWLMPSLAALLVVMVVLSLLLLVMVVLLLLCEVTNTVSTCVGPTMCVEPQGTALTC